MALYVHTTCLNLSEALSGHYPFICPPRLRSLRSLSLGLLESQPLRGCEVSIQRVVSDTDILFSVWSLTVPCADYIRLYFLFEALSGHYPFYLPQTALAPLT